MQTRQERARKEGVYGTEEQRGKHDELHIHVMKLLRQSKRRFSLLRYRELRTSLAYKGNKIHTTLIYDNKWLP